MAASGIVGILRALLTVDDSKFQAALKRDADAASAFGKTLAKVGDTAQKITPQLTRFEKELRGERVVTSAHNMARAVENIGGAARLTAQEQARVNRMMTEAIDKYRAFGQTAPKAMLDLAKATSQAGTPTKALETRMIAIGSAIGTAFGNLATGAIQSVGRALVQAAADGQKFSQLAPAFDRLTASLGTSRNVMLEMTRSATKGLISDLDLMQATNKAVLLGLPVTAREMADLSKAAVALGRAMGQDATQSLDDLITALGRVSPMILDNLGLTVKVGEANEVYAATLGKSVAQLTEAEKKQAFYNAAMEAARQKTETLGDQTLTTTDQINRLLVAVGNLVTKLAARINQNEGLIGVIGRIATAAERAVRAIDDLIRARDRLGVSWSKGLSTPQGAATGAGAGVLDATLRAIFGFDSQALTREGDELARIAREEADKIAEAGRPKFPTPPGLRTILGPTEAELRRDKELIDAIAAAAEKAAAAQRRWNEAFAELNQGMTWWLAGMKTAPALIKSLDDSLTSAFIPAVQLSKDALAGLAQQGMWWAKGIVSQNASIVESSTEVANYWQTEFKDIALDTWRDISFGLTDALGDMFVGLNRFESRWEAFWEGLRQTFSRFISDILNEFLNRFLRGVLASLGGKANPFSSAFAGMFGGALGGLGGGAAAAIPAAGAGGALTAGLTVATPAAIGGTAAGGGLGATMAGLATNPFTIAAAGGLALGLGITKKGWFRGGEEGIKVNPARDAFLRQFGGFDSLAALLTSVTGEPGGGRLFRALAQADTMKEFNAATLNILTLLNRRGMSTLPAAPGSRMPPSPLPALTAASTVMPGASIPASTVPGAARTGQAPVTMNVTIQAWDRADMSEAFRTEIIPRFNDALHLNTGGLRTAVEGV